MKKMIKTMFFVLILTLFCGATVVFANENEVILISNAEEFVNIKDNPYGNYELSCDIDMEGVNWEPFSFYGTLDGKGYSVLNLEVTKVGEDSVVTYDGNYKEYDTVFSGLFTCIEEATITNISFYDVCVDIDIEKNCFIGAIAGYSKNSTITNTNVYGTLSLTVNAPMFGVGGVVGFGNGVMDAIKCDMTLICIDTNAGERDEQFMGGLCAAGYMNMDNCEVNIDGYVSDHGYVHNGGLMGMYFFYPKGTKFYGSITSNRVEGKITFFEDNTDRRAYCKPIVGEYLTYEFEYTGNWESFLRDEIFEYDKNLLPHMCENPEYDVVVTEPLVDAWGYSTHTCKACGYEYVDDYRIYIDPASLETEESTEQTVIESEEDSSSVNTEFPTMDNNDGDDNPVVYKIIIVVAVVFIVITIAMVVVMAKSKKK